MPGLLGDAMQVRLRPDAVDARLTRFPGCVEMQKRNGHLRIADMQSECVNGGEDGSRRERQTIPASRANSRVTAAAEQPQERSYQTGTLNIEISQPTMMPRIPIADSSLAQSACDAHIEACRWSPRRQPASLYY